MDIRPPKPPEESFTITKAKWIQKFSNIVGAISGAVVLLDQAGASALLPAKLQKYVTPGTLIVALAALYTGNSKQASALIVDRSNKPDIFTKKGTPGRNKEEALMQVFMTVAELELAKRAVSGELVPANITQKQEQFEQKILGKLDQFNPVSFPADPQYPPSPRAVREGQPMGLVAMETETESLSLIPVYIEGQKVPTPTPGFSGLVRSLIPDEVI